jgi:hypothetical protein
VREQHRRNLVRPQTGLAQRHSQRANAQAGINQNARAPLAEENRVGLGAGSEDEDLKRQEKKKLKD